MKMKYQTKTQVLLKILLDDALVDLMFSNERMLQFEKEKDFETLEIERPMNNHYKVRIENINQLIELERNSYSSAPTSVQIGLIGANRIKQEWISSYV